MTAAFGRCEVLTETPPQGVFARLPEAVEAVHTAGGLNPLIDPPALVELLDAAAADGTLDVFTRATANGFAWAPCNVCGEATLRTRGKGGRTPSGAVSKAKATPVKCRMSYRRNADGAVVRCHGTHVPL